MTPDVQRYDDDMRMFRDRLRPMEIAHLCFLRWLADRGALEHPAAGPPSGAVAAALILVQPPGEAA